MKRTQNQFAVCLAKCVILCILMVIIEGQTYNLSGSAPYGIRGGDYRFTCHISGGNFIRTDIFVFKKDSVKVCEQPFSCDPSPSSDNRSTCGCINGNNSQLYLNITNVQSTDAGTWTCGDSFNINTSPPVTLPVYYGPENIRFTPSSIAVIENESRTVNCSADCNPPCTISWYNGGDSSGTIISSSNGLLQLNNIQRQDTAYTCQAEYTILTTTPLTKTLQITVYYGPENIRFTPTGSSITVIENESRTVTCSAECNPPCNINWKKGSVPSGSNGLLSMNNITRQQSGNYTCQVTNTQIPDLLQSKQLMVIVHYPPNITNLTSDATNNMIDEYSTVTFTCSVDSLPSSAIAWFRSPQGEQLYSGSQYTIPKASCQHTDNYTCTARNNIGQPVSKPIPLYVKCSPRENMVTKRNITNRINTTINLEVDIIAYPPPTFTWYHTPTRQIINTATTQQVSTINYKSTLKITLNSTLFGDYIVSVVNDVGVQNFTITVIDGEPPEPPDKLGNNNMLTIVGGIIGILVIAGVITVIGVVIYRRMAREDSPEDNVPLSNKAKTRPNEMVIDDNLTYEGSDHLFGPQTGAGPGKGQTDNNPMSSKTGQNNQMIIDDNLLYEGSDDLFGPQNGTESEKSKKPAKKPDPEAIYTAVVKKKNGQDNNTASGEVIKKKNGQDNNTASGETGTYENVDLKANPIPTKKLTFNKEGLNYADVVFTNKTPAAKDVKPVYHDAVEYAGIQYGVRGPTPPPVSDSSDDDDTPPPAPTSKQKTKPVKTKKK
ncbi:hypothetical protein SNE40_017394 [Patella caerulea]|uniref:Ig-like domain-containing protein n=1 Tax=Patella caerulea TaxID=87958 RepID=A0AAN8JEZ5_PATCE